MALCCTLYWLYLSLDRLLNQSTWHPHNLYNTQTASRIIKKYFPTLAHMLSPGHDMLRCGEKPYEVMRQWVGQLRQTVPAVKICSPSLPAWSVSSEIPQEGESAATLISSLPQVSLPNQTQLRLASAWMSSIRLAAWWASQTSFSKLHYGFAI